MNTNGDNKNEQLILLQFLEFMQADASHVRKECYSVYYWTSALCAPIFLVVSKAHILIAIKNAETEILCTKNGKKP